MFYIFKCCTYPIKQKQYSRKPRVPYYLKKLTLLNKKRQEVHQHTLPARTCGYLRKNWQIINELGVQKEFL